MSCVVCGFAPEKIYEVEGNWLTMQCAVRCHDRIYPWGELAEKMASAEQGQSSVLVSELPPERSQSVLAEGGINGELSGKTEDVLSHWADTVQAGAGLSDPNAVRGMSEAALGIVRWLAELGTAFQRTPEGLALRRLGGHRKARTLFAGSSTGKADMSVWSCSFGQRRDERTFSRPRNRHSEK